MTAIDWQVIAVFDDGPDGATGFAYTKGLARRGLPELHIWARATHGADVDDRFVLSAHDTGMLLNRIGSEMLEGRLEPGDSTDLDVDEGLTRLTVTLTGPVRAASVDAYLLDEEQEVLACRWSIDRSRPTGSVSHRAVEATVDGVVQRSGMGAEYWCPHHRRVGPFEPVIALLRGAAREMAINRALIAGSAAYEKGAILGLAATLAHSCGRETAHDAACAMAAADADVVADIGAGDEFFVVEGFLAAVYSLWVVADLVLVEGAEHCWEDEEAGERSARAREFDLLAQSALFPLWAGCRIKEHPAIAGLASDPVDPEILGERWRGLDWRSMETAHDVFGGVARAGHGWPDEVTAAKDLLGPRLDRTARLTMEAIVARQFQYAAAVALHERLPGVDPRRVTRVLRRLRSARRRAA
jgi:hypothetical protein